jgi:hypothetical protein
MERVKDYPRVEFSATALRKIVEMLKDIVKDPAKTSMDRLRIQKKGESWRYDTFEEFLAQHCLLFSFRSESWTTLYILHDWRRQPVLRIKLAGRP